MVNPGSSPTRRFLFTPLASTGYVYPAIGIAKELARRGHRIGFATGRQFRKLLCSQGFDFLPPLIGDTQAFSVRKWGLPEGFRQQASHAAHAADDFKPDAIVTSALTVSPLAVAKQRMTPSAVIGMGTYPWPPLTNPSSASKFHHAESLYRNMTLLYQQACEWIGMKTPDQVQPNRSPLLGDIFLMRNIRQFFPLHDSYPSSVRFVGDCSWEPVFDSSQDPALLKFLQQSGPVIFVQHDGKRGRPYYSDGVLQPAVNDYLPHVQAYARASGIRLLICTNQSQWTDGTDEGSTGVMFRKHVPYRFVLPRVNAVIGNGSSSVMLAGLAHGRPMAFFHHGAESNFVARQCRIAEVALTQRSNAITNQSVAEMVDRLLSSQTLNERARKFQALFGSINSTALAASQLESITENAHVG